LRHRIFQTALILFAQHGFGDTTVEQITEAADIAKGTFFNHFDGKTGLLREIVESQRAKLQRAQERALEPGRNMFEIVRSMALDLTGAANASPVLFRSLFGAVMMTPEIWDLVHELLAQARNMLEKTLERGQKRNELQDHKTAAELACDLQNMLLGSHLGWAMQEQADLHEWLKHSLIMFWQGAAMF
jgi:AcrR family transcriptional regulator